MDSKHGENAKSRKNEDNKKNKIIIIIIFIVVICGAVYFYKNPINIGNDELKGTWTTDDVTIYEFFGNGKGLMKLPNSEYSFSYILHKNQVYIDFEDEKAKDSDYEYSLENEKLILKGIKTTTGTYTFTKK